MVDIKTELKKHPTEAELAGFLDRSLSGRERARIESHLAGCPECLAKIVSAYDSVKMFRTDGPKKRKGKLMKKINLYLLLSAIAFILSFVVPRYFIQLLVATLLLGIKWIVDSKSTKMLVMIYEAWKNGGEREASRIIERLELNSKNRL